MEELGFTGERLVPEKLAKTGQLYSEHITRYIFASSFVKDRYVLDAGCGCGYGSNLLSQHARKVTGIDISNDAIAYCNQHYKKDNLDFHQMDCCHMVFDDDTFGIVTSFEFIEHLQEPSRFLQEANRVLKPDGLFVVSTPNNGKFDDSTNPFHLFNMDSRKFKEILTSHFNTVEFFGQKINPFFLLNKNLYFLQKQLDDIKIKLNHLPSFFLKSLVPIPIKEAIKKSFGISVPCDEVNLRNLKISCDYPMCANDISIERDDIENAEYMIGVCTKKVQ